MTICRNNLWLSLFNFNFNFNRLNLNLGSVQLVCNQGMLIMYLPCLVLPCAALVFAKSRCMMKNKAINIKFISLTRNYVYDSCGLTSMN